MTNTTIKSVESNKGEFVNKMFANIATKYDLLNNLMTLGMHCKWKESLIKYALTENNCPKIALDLCSGTGDLAILLHKYSPKTKIICIDNCIEMLNIASEKLKNKNISNIEVLNAGCENLNYSDSSIYLITIGFGLRNLQNKEQCIKTSYKSLKENGVFACLDISSPENKLWSKLYKSYFFKVIPQLGALFAKDKEAYTYLPESLLSWYKQSELLDILKKTGFKKSYYKNILGGVAAIHIGIK